MSYASLSRFAAARKRYGPTAYKGETTMVFNHKRKQLYVNKTVQRRFLWRIVCYWMVYHLFVVHGLFLTYGVMTNDRPRPFIQMYGEFLSSQVPLLVVALATLPMILYDMLKLTNRVVGPLVRIERTLKQMMSGEPVEPLKLRNKDLVLEFLGVFNEFIGSHNDKYESRTDIRLDAESDEFVQQQVASGQYESADDVIRKAVRSMRDRASTPRDLDQVLEAISSEPSFVNAARR